ncbi:acetyl-coenzyme A transporter 1 [Culex quinquefasciatus]|uniref:Acetyl-coenzyme A transporter 1 n=1 Tax=Culex quinquefasciatus TaxID=7176 RepID=B0WU51_CULQU|nr:acetyl-coenzyme A transporter 1 [Culex quinquefasciatus]|eukprot:XP_001870902.1 acetyl-coenzyme A transporter 1 [Culex quinquefasciatus]
MKLLWAPIVDPLYWSRFSRHKQLIPTQYLIGLFMLILSLRVNRWLENSEGNDVASHVAPNIPILTVIFIALNFLAATQDIAVGADDAEAYFLGYVAFMALESTEFCDSYLRSEPADECLVTLPVFLWFCGLLFLVTTTLIALLVVPLNPLQIILPLVFSKGWPYQIALTLHAAAVVWFIPAMIYDHHVPYYYYQILLTNYGLYQIALYIMFVAVMAFFARINDPAVGETYMTLLNMLSNLGGNWPITVVLWMVDEAILLLKLINPTINDMTIMILQLPTDEEERLMIEELKLSSEATISSSSSSLMLSVAGLISGTSSLASKQAALLEDPRMVQQRNVQAALFQPEPKPTG